MNGGLVVQPGERSATSGAGLIDSGTSLYQAIESQNWVDAALSGVAVGFDAVATYSDPLGSLFAAGIGWVIDHFEPIKGWFDDLAGNPEEVKAFAGTWLNVSTAISAANTSYVVGANQKLEKMTGPNVERYREHVEETSDKLSFFSGAARAMSIGTDVAAVIVGFVHGLLRDAIAQVAGAICSYVAELVITLGAATPLVIHQATTRISALAAEIGPKVRGLKTSVTDLDSLMRELRDILNDIPRFLGNRYSVPNHPNLRWSNVVNDPNHLLQGMSVRDAMNLINVKQQYRHILANDPALWQLVIRDAFRDGVPGNATDAGKNVNEAVRRQLEGNG